MRLWLQVMYVGYTYLHMQMKMWQLLKIDRYIFLCVWPAPTRRNPTNKAAGFIAVLQWRHISMRRPVKTIPSMSLIIIMASIIIANHQQYRHHRRISFIPAYVCLIIQIWICYACIHVTPPFRYSFTCVRVDFLQGGVAGGRCQPPLRSTYNKFSDLFHLMAGLLLLYWRRWRCNDDAVDFDVRIIHIPGAR